MIIITIILMRYVYYYMFYKIMSVLNLLENVNRLSILRLDVILAENITE